MSDHFGTLCIKGLRNFMLLQTTKYSMGSRCLQSWNKFLSEKKKKTMTSTLFFKNPVKEREWTIILLIHPSIRKIPAFDHFVAAYSSPILILRLSLPYDIVRGSTIVFIKLYVPDEINKQITFWRDSHIIIISFNSNIQTQKWCFK